MNVCIPNAYSLVPALKLFVEKDDEINFVYPGILNHFKYRYDVNNYAVHEMSTIEDLSVFSKMSLQLHPQRILMFYKY